MVQIDEVALRKYLKRCIAEKNKVINGLCRNFVYEGRTFRKDIYREFARGNNNLYRIDKDINYRGKKDISIYNYFDLDTLISYNKYLETIIRTVEANKTNARRQYTTPRDMYIAIHQQVPKHFIFHKNEPVTGFYNPEDTIHTLVDDQGKLTYERTPDKRSFDKQYDVRVLSQMLDAYIDEKFAYISCTQEDEEEDLAEYYICTMKIFNKDFNISRIEDYFDSDFAPIRYVEGETDNNRYSIRGFVDMNGDEYCGDAYNDEGEIMIDSTQTGIDLYVDGILKDKKYRY